MSLKQRLARLERDCVGAGCCPECGWERDAVRTIEVHTHGKGEPVGYWYQKGWPDYRPGEYFAYPPDPRPLCPVCGLHDGPILLLNARYEGDSIPNEPNEVVETTDAEELPQNRRQSLPAIARNGEAGHRMRDNG